MNIPEFETPKLTNLGVQVLYLLSLRAAPLVNPSDKILAHALPRSYILGLCRDYFGIILGLYWDTVKWKRRSRLGTLRRANACLTKGASVVTTTV